MRFFPQVTEEEWVAVAYGSLMYIARVLKEIGYVVTVRFLRRADGYYETVKKDEEVEKALVFMRGVTVTWKGIGRYDVPDMKNVLARHKRHTQMFSTCGEIKCGACIVSHQVRYICFLGQSNQTRKMHIYIVSIPTTSLHNFI